MAILVHSQQLLGIAVEDGCNLVVGKDRRESLVHSRRQSQSASWRGEDGVAAVQKLVGPEQLVHGEDLARHGPSREVEPELLLQEFGGVREAIVAQVSRRLRFVAVDHAQGHEAFQNGWQHAPAMRDDPFDVGVDLRSARQHDVGKSARGVEEELQSRQSIVVHQRRHPVEPRRARHIGRRIDGTGCRGMDEDHSATGVDLVIHRPQLRVAMVQAEIIREKHKPIRVELVHRPVDLGQ